MPYRTLRSCLDDLAATGQLVRIDEEIDPNLEAAEIQRRVYQAGGPAVFFNRLRGTRFPAVSNLFGTLDRCRFLFRDRLAAVQRLVELKIDPSELAKRPTRYLSALRSAWHMRPKRVRRAPLVSHETTLDQLPQIVSWPRDGGPYVTLPLVYTEDARTPGIAKSNLGMYRVQLAGNRYAANRECGLHYQIHRGIGVHHAAALAQGKPLRVHVYVGGAPAMTFAAVMPLPEGLSELGFAGALGGHRIPLYYGATELPLYAEADFCIVGTLDAERLLPEGPFGDHLGYYSLAHDFPVLHVEKVYHRPDAIWPFTVVGRPPQEDTVFGEMIHEITGPIIPTVVPGVQAVHAVDAAGVHPLLLAIGNERYVPYQERTRPMELLTQANALLGQGQLSLAKYVLIACAADDPELDVHDIAAMFQYVLARIDWTRDCHFQTCTTIDTLDYSGGKLNEGSKVVWAAVGPKRRELPTAIEAPLRLPDGFTEPRIALPGVLVVQGPKYGDYDHGTRHMDQLTGDLTERDAINAWPLIVVVDDSDFAAQSLNNFLWVTFTRSDPAQDTYGIGSFSEHKHWGCRGSLVVDARLKPHHAPPLEADPTVSRRVDRLFAAGGPLAKWG